MKTTEMHFGLTVLQTKISTTKNTSSAAPVIAFICQYTGCVYDC